jgi:hypothetical protein
MSCLQEVGYGLGQESQGAVSLSTFPVMQLGDRYCASAASLLSVSSQGARRLILISRADPHDASWVHPGLGGHHRAKASV